MNKQQEELAMRLDLLIPMKWISDNYPNVEHIFSKMVELNQEWVEEVVNRELESGLSFKGDLKLSDVLHDFRGIYGNFACPPEEKDEHFLPRIQSEDILGDFDENGDAVDVNKVNGYTNIQTYRLCVWLDNSVNYHNKGLFDYFFDLVRDGEFEESDYEVIDWNEVVERYSNEQRSHYLGSITRS